MLLQFSEFIVDFRHLLSDKTYRGKKKNLCLHKLLHELSTKNIMLLKDSHYFSFVFV